MIHIVDAQGVVVDANPAECAGLGYPRDGLVGRHLMELISPERREEVGAVLQGPLGGAPLLRRDGTTLPVEINATPQQVGGSVAAVRWIARDTTERKQAQTALQESERRFRATVEDVNLAAVALDTDGRILFCNRFLLTLTGWQHLEVIGRNWFEMFLPESVRGEVFAMFRGGIASGSLPMNSVNEISTRAGELRLVRWSNVLQRDPAGKAIGTVSLGEDITERRHLEAKVHEQLDQLARGEAEGRRLLDVAEKSRRALLGVLEDQKAAAEAARLSEEKYRSLVESMNEGLWVLDGNELITFINPRACEMLGYAKEELLGRPATVVYDEENRKIRREQLALRRRERKGSFEIAWLRKDGTRVDMIVAPRPRYDEQGALVEIVSVFTDITERKRTEEALRVSSARLEALGRRLLEVQETERRAIARELHDEVGGVLTAVKLNLMSLRGKDPGEAALADGLALVDGAIRSVRSLSLDLRPPVLDDMSLIPALRWYCEGMAQRAGIPIELALQAIDLEAAPHLQSACFRIMQEAVTNALRHAKASRIEVSLRRHDGGFVLEIADDGRGFDTAAARKRAIAGESGGLLGMEERATLLGGRLAIDAAPGAGARVRAEFSVPEGGFE